MGTTYSCTGAHYRQNGGSWWTPLSGGRVCSGDTGTGVSYETRLAFDFGAIRTKNSTHYISAAKFYFHQTNEYAADPVITKITNSSYSSLASGSSGTSVVNGWASVTLSSTMIAELTDATATYLGTYNSTNSTYIEFYVTGSSYVPYLDITWVSRNTAPSTPGAITISTAGGEYCTASSGWTVMATSSLTVSCAAASDSQDAETALSYQWEYSVNGGAWTVLRAWTTSASGGKTATLSLTNISAEQSISFRVAAKDTGGLISSYKNSTSNSATSAATAAYGMKVVAPDPPLAVTTPSAFSSTSNATTASISWSASGSYYDYLGVRYDVDLYDPYSASWKSVVSAGSALSATVNYYTELGLGGTLRYYYQTGNKIRVRSRYATAVQGTTLINTTYVESGLFSINYRSAPVVALGTFSTTNLYEGTSYDIPITKTSQGNELEADGTAMTFNYRVDLIYSGITTTVATSSAYSWASLPTTMSFTVPSVASTADITGCTIKVYVIASSSLSNNYSLTSRTVKRYRAPVATITAINRLETSFTITYSITDTGLTSQSTAEIYCNAAGTRVTFSTSTSVPTLTGLTNQTHPSITVTSTSTGTCTLYVFNNPGDSMAKKSAVITTNIPTFLPNFRIQSSGVYARGALYVWDANGVAREVYHEGNLTVDLSGLVPKTGASYIQSTGRSTSWGSTSGTSTGGFNTIMGTGSGATWILSGTSGGTFSFGIQALDTGSSARIYTDATTYFTLSGASGTIWTSGNLAFGTAANTMAEGDHTHSYLPLTGGTISSNLTVTGTTTTNGTIVTNGTLDINGIIVVDASSYGATVPASGVAGQIFFKTS